MSVFVDAERNFYSTELHWKNIGLKYIKLIVFVPFLYLWRASWFELVIIFVKGKLISAGDFATSWLELVIFWWRTDQTFVHVVQFVLDSRGCGWNVRSLDIRVSKLSKDCSVWFGSSKAETSFFQILECLLFLQIEMVMWRFNL